jgi:hypothetical protein
MTTPQQPGQQNATPAQQQLAVALWNTQTTDEAINVVGLFLLLDPPAAAHIVTVVFHPTAVNPRPWRKLPGSGPALIQAQYLLNAGQRIADGLKAGQPLQALLNRESVYGLQHRRAQTKRATAMAASRKAKRQYGGRLLGWYAHKDDKVTPACRIADGANFNPNVGPWPGTLHGGTCRCLPGPAHDTLRMVVTEWVKAGLGEHAEDAA